MAATREHATSETADEAGIRLNQEKTKVSADNDLTRTYENRH